MKKRNAPPRGINIMVDPLNGGPRPDIDIPLQKGKGNQNIDIDISGVGGRPSAPPQAAGKAAKTKAFSATARKRREAPPTGPVSRGGGQAPRDDVYEEREQPRPVSRKTLRRRRRRKRLAIGIALAMLLLVGFALSVTVLFPIKAFEVSGECRYTQDEIVTAFGHNAGENIFQFKIATASESLAVNLPYLETVKVRRRLPGTVVFLVTPATEVYYLPMGEGGLVLSAGLKVLRQTGEAPAEVCTLSGLDIVSFGVGKPLVLTDPSQKEELASLSAAIAQAGITEVTAIDMGDGLDMSFVWRARVTVTLGTSAQLSHKLSLIARALADVPNGVSMKMDASVAGTVVTGPAE